MIEEDYVSFETAELLKEKGFDEVCFSCYEYFESGVTLYKGWIFEYKGYSVLNSSDRIKCPTLQMAVKWLREVHNMYIEICVGAGYIYGDVVFKSAVYNDELDCLSEPESFPSYEEAVEAALKYCLERLI